MDKEQLLTIGRPSRQCSNCGEPIHELERHPSTLSSSPPKKLERQDFCPVCWEHLKKEAFDSYWMTRRELKAKKARKLSRRERSVALRVLFESLWDRRDSEDLGPRLYFLAHLLMKWGGLKWCANQVDETGSEIVIFENTATGDMLEIASTRLEDEQIAALKQEVEEFLKQYAAEDQEIAL